MYLPKAWLVKNRHRLGTGIWTQNGFLLTEKKTIGHVTFSKDDVSAKEKEKIMFLSGMDMLTELKVL